MWVVWCLAFGVSWFRIAACLLFVVCCLVFVVACLFVVFCLSCDVRWLWLLFICSCRCLLFTLVLRRFGVPCSAFGARCVVCVVHAFCVLRVVNWLVVFRACFSCLVLGVRC